MGLAQAFGWDNPFVNTLAANRGALSSALFGAVARPQDPWGGAAQGALRGQQIDTANELRVAEEQARQDQIAQQQQQQNRTLEFLRTQLSPDQFQAVESGAVPIADAYEQFAAQGGGDPFTLGQGQQRFDPQGNVIAQVDPRATTPLVTNIVGQSEFGTIPPGFELFTDPTTGARSMKPIAGGPAARGIEDTASTAIASAETSLAQIDAVINDPNLGAALGVGGLAPAIPGTAQAGTVGRIEQLQGAAFLQAFETLKGGGVITEIEGEKATAAIARLNRVQTKGDFVQALNDLKEIIQLGLDRARRQGGLPTQAVFAPTGIEGVTIRRKQ